MADTLNEHLGVDPELDVPGALKAWHQTEWPSGDSGGLVDVRSFGAACDGATDDTAALVSALESGESLFLPGWSVVDPDALSFSTSGQMLVGGGRNRTGLRLMGNGRLLDMSGSATGDANHLRFCRLADLSLDGNDKSGDGLLRIYYANHFFLERVAFASYDGVGVDAVELWDSTFDWLHFDWVSSATLPCVRFRNAAETEGFGSGVDNCNNLRIWRCTFESYRGGALWVTAGESTANPNNFDVRACKMETYFARQPSLVLDSYVKNTHVDTLLLAHMGLDDGASPSAGIDWQPAGDCSIDRIHIINGGVSTYTSCVNVAANGTDGILSIDRVSAMLGTAPSTAVISFPSGGAAVNVGRCRTNTGQLFSGDAFSYGAGITDGSFTVAYAASWTPDLSYMGHTVVMSLTGDTEIQAPLNARRGSRLTFVFNQDDVGGRVVTFDEAFKVAWAPDTAADRTNTVSFVNVGSVWVQVGATVGLN